LAFRISYLPICSTTSSCVDLALTDVSEEGIASIFRAEKSASRNQREQVAADCRSTECHIPEDGFIVTAEKTSNLTALRFFFSSYLLHVSTALGHHQANAYLAKTVALFLK
jgi:hypothetical protein